MVRRPRPDEGRFADLGAMSQVFTHRRFTELEFVWPLTGLAPGQDAVAEQLWVIRPDPSPAVRCDVEAIAEVADRLLA